MSEFKVDAITNRNGSHGPQICGITTFGGSGLTIPSGGLSGARGRGFFAGGETPSEVNIIDKIEIATTGSATDFGDLTFVRDQSGGASSSTRGLFAGGRAPEISTINYVVLSSEGNGFNFGDLTEVWNSGKGVSDNITAVWMGGEWSGSYTGDMKMEYSIIASLGNGYNFGNLSNQRVYSQTASFESPTRGFIGAGGGRNSPYYQTSIDVITIATRGDSTHFGELTQARKASGGCSSTTRGIFAGGDTGSKVDTMDYITMASEGNAIDFGNLSATACFCAGTSNTVRGVVNLADTGSIVNTIDFISISTTGNGLDFGDLTGVRRFCAPASDSHGGLAQ
tara:strand:+ start:71 stop:1084 length:1014 start_codon:yes stop_codon:yes gene_type:complete